MKITIIGGGPAGLYFAILMKKSDPSHDITVYERNAPGATFGWGVVFSDKTLSYLRDNDLETHDEITQSFETWDNVDIVHRGEKITIRGNKFSGIARIRLLNILQARCADLGIRMLFETEAGDLGGLAADCDLMVGADGVSSGVRAAFAAAFQPSLDIRANKYIWFGTERLFHGLTLTFHENADGVFAAHSYKFSKQLSTFIVECDPETWENGGFANCSDDETRTYLEDVFRDDLEGHRLLSNNSKWIHFLLVKNRHWHTRNIVLLGDALHTAHFSIGSGTKLALEDSIALANAFTTDSTVGSALATFENNRRPVIDEYQDAALESMVWFETARRYIHLEPMQFSYGLMTRSKKIDYDNLKRRDPEFISAYDRALAR